MTRPRIAVYAIARDEERCVERWAASAADADLVLLADTGSSDGTAAEAARLGIAVHAFEVEPFRFDEARNRALGLVPDDIDVCIPLDLDEVLDAGWRPLVESAWALGATRIGYTLEWSWADDRPPLRYTATKIHARHGYRWRFPVHEDLFTTGEETVVRSDVRIVHLRDPSKPRRSYLDLLQLAANENPREGRIAHMLANELRRHSPQEAIEHARRALNLTLDPYERMHSLLIVSWLEPAEREERILEACSEFGGQREPWCELSKLRAEQHRWRESYLAASRALSIIDPPDHYLVNVDAWGAWPDELAATAAHALGDEIRADHHSRRTHVPAATREERGAELVPTFVVVPVRDRIDLTLSMLSQLAEDDGHEAAFIFDNGSSDGTWEMLVAESRQRTDIVPLRRPDANIHQMWNEGWARSVARSRGPCNVLFANNDVHFVKGTIASLARALRSDDSLWAVHPTLDDEIGIDQEPPSVGDSPWLWGCFFLVKGEIPLRFDELYRWHYGETDLSRQIAAAGRRVGIVPQVSVRHLAGASTPADSPLLDERFTGDAARYHARWGA